MDDARSPAGPAGPDPERAPPDPARRLNLALHAGAAMAVLLGLVATYVHSYLLFHSVAEVFSVVVAGAIFIVAWNTRKIVSVGYLVVMGTAYLAVGGLDFFHALSYAGMKIIDDATPNTATQLWVAARLLEAAALAVVPSYLHRPVATWRVLAVVGVATGGLALAIGRGWFPVCYAEGQGLTPFKIGAELLVVALLGVALVHLFARRGLLPRHVVLMLMGSLALTIVAELIFTLYTDPQGPINVSGHLVKVASFYLIYRATVVTGLAHPFALLFRDLRRTEDHLRRANDDLRSYAHRVSHDLKGPLAAVSGACEVLSLMARRGDVSMDDPKVREVTDIAQRSVRQAVRLTDDILALAEAGQQPRRVAEVDLERVLAEIAAEVRGASGEATPEVHITPGLGTLMGDRTQIYQVFANLVRNAVRHAAGEGREVRVSRLPDPTPGRHRFEVRDNGDGVPEELVDTLFEPFVKGPRGGSGIGLSTVMRLVQVYDGEISVRNDGGAVFELVLNDRS